MLSSIGKCSLLLLIAGLCCPTFSATTTIPTLVVPLDLSFEASAVHLDAAPDVPALLKSPVFRPFAFPGGETTQYADALLRVSGQSDHTLLAQPEIKPLRIAIPLGFGYLLTSKSSGRTIGIADSGFVQKEILKQLPHQQGKLVIALTHNTAFYVESDATICCTWGTHSDSFVLASYLSGAPAIVEDRDVQPLTEQLAEFMIDRLGNKFPPWRETASGRCAGEHAGSSYFLLEPTDLNHKNNFPASKAFDAGPYHLANVATLNWYLHRTGSLSFPDTTALTQPSVLCPADRPSSAPKARVAAAPHDIASASHKLIGYWVGYEAAETLLPPKEISPQWDIVIVAFSSPAHDKPEGTMRFQTPAGFTADQFKQAVAALKSQGRKVILSLGGGGQFFSLNDPRHIPDFVESVGHSITEFGFDGVDIDYETPSLALDPGDSDFKHPTTPSVVNLIAGLRQLHDRFGPKFMLSLVPEGPQVPAAHASYGGQFGSFLPLAYNLRDILSFIDIQDYNTPPLQGLDGEIYQSGNVDYHAATTELLLQGFNVAGDPKRFFPPVPAHKVAVGFLTDDTTPDVVIEAMRYLITGQAPAGTHYKLRRPQGYADLMGAMFWTIDDDARGNYNYSNVLGPQLHNNH